MTYTKYRLSIKKNYSNNPSTKPFLVEKKLREKKYARVKRTQKKGKKRMQRTEKNNVEYKKM